jgi:hypothetical protein
MLDPEVSQPNPDTPLGSIPGVSPTPMPPLGATGGPAPVLGQQPSPDAQPFPPDKHTILGHAVRHIANSLEGKRTVYEPQDDGTIKESQVPRRPGGLFRDLILGALVGGAAASEPVPAGSGPLVGLARGGAAAYQNQLGQDSKARNRALQNAQLEKQADDRQREYQKTIDAKQIVEATKASSTVSDMNLGHNIGLHSPQEIDSLNQSNSAIQQAAMKNGGVLAPIPGNGEKGNGPAMMAKYNQDSSIMEAPQDFHRILNVQHDTSGLQYKDGKWVEKDGSTPDDDYWNKHSTVSLIDIPASLWGKNLTLPRKTWNDGAGRTVSEGNPTDPIQGTFGSLFGYNLKNKQQTIKDREALTTPIKPTEYEGEKSKLQAWRAIPEADRTKEQSDYINKRGPLIDDYTPLKTPSDGFPILKDPEAATAYGNEANRVLRDPKSTPEQKQTAQAQLKYANDSLKTLANTHIRLAADTKAAEVRAENAVIDQGAKGAAGLPDDARKRFSELPGPVQAQLKDVKTRDIASLFALADGDTGKNTFPARVYKGSNQLTQADAVGWAKQINPDWDEKLFNTKQKLVNNYTDSKKEGGQIETFNNFLNHAADAADVTSKWRTTGSPFLNIGMNKLRDQAAGDPQYAKLVAALEPVRKEYMSFLNSNRAEHTEDLQVMDKILKDSATPAQIEEGLKQLSHTSVLRLDSLNENWKTVTGGNYPNLLTPKGKIAAAKLGQGDAVAQYQSGGRLTAGSTRQSGAAGGGFDASKLQNLHTNGKVTIGWDGKNWVDSTTGKPAQ